MPGDGQRSVAKGLQLVPRKDQIVGQRIDRVCEAYLREDPYCDHYLKLSNGLLVKFSNGNLVLVDELPSAISDATPTFALAAPAADRDKPHTCIGSEIQNVFFSVAGSQDQRYQTYIFLTDGRYLMSGMGFNYTELDLDTFARWYPQNKHGDMLIDFWSNLAFNPFGIDAQKGKWSGWTMISPPSDE